jgi:hydroxymethylglutaryl-CoA lyase
MPIVGPSSVAWLSMAEHVSIREVGPRDGLQREEPVDVERRALLVAALAACGFSDIEVVAFVSERAVPAMAGAAQIVAGLPEGDGCTWWALVPNLTGAQRALQAGVRHVSVTVSCSEQYSARNVKMSVAESTAEALAIIAAVPFADVVLSCAFGSPYGEDISPSDVAVLAARFVEAGASVTLADTTGIGTPRRIEAVLSATGPDVGLHLHDTRGTALVNAYRALELGVRRFDSAVGGLGGSPFAAEAGGNLASEDLVFLLQDLGYETGVDLDRVVAVHAQLSEWLGRPLASRVGRAALAEHD